MTSASRGALVVSVIGLSLVLGSCRGGVRTAPRAPGTVVVASFDFSESVVLAELYAQALERAGIAVERRARLASREEVEPALEQGLVDLVPEYLGTALTFLDKGGGRATADAGATYALLRSAFAARGVTTLAMAPAQNANAIAVTRATATRLDLTQVSDLAPVAGGMVFGGPPQCPERQFCMSGLRSVYGLEFKSFRSLDTAGPLTVGALEGGEVDVALLFTTTPQVASSGFVLLADDKGLQPAENVVPVVRTALVRRLGDRVAQALDPVSAQLTSDELRNLNEEVEVKRRPPQAVAAAWLARH